MDMDGNGDVDDGRDQLCAGPEDEEEQRLHNITVINLPLKLMGLESIMDMTRLDVEILTFSSSVPSRLAG